MPRPWSRPTRSTRCGCSAELSARLPDERDRRRRLRLGGQLVRPAPEVPRRHARLAVGHARHDGAGRAVRDRRQVRPPRPAGDRLRRRRRHADERHGRADHDREVLASSGATRGWSSPSCTTTTSTRSPGRCGPWRARRSSSSPRACPTSTTPASPQPRAAGHRGRQARRHRPGLGRRARRRPPDGARRPHRARTSRRSRRTRPSSR